VSLVVVVRILAICRREVGASPGPFQKRVGDQT